MLVAAEARRLEEAAGSSGWDFGWLRAASALTFAQDLAVFGRAVCPATGAGGQGKRNTHRQGAKALPHRTPPCSVTRPHDLECTRLLPPRLLW